MRNLARTIVLPLAVFLLCCLAGEGLLRLKNASMQNYDIEMWRYSNTILMPSADPVLGHEQRPGASAVLQGAEFRIDEWGNRGPMHRDLAKAERRILVLGASITLGWGVSEGDAMPGLLQRAFGGDGKVVVINGGVANYDTVRYVHRFLTKLQAQHPTDIVVHYFLGDAEPRMPPGGGNWLLSHSELAVTTWLAVTRLVTGINAVPSRQRYAEINQPGSPEFRRAIDALSLLAAYARDNNVRVILAMMPDVHDLKDYPFANVHQTMRATAESLGFGFVDLLPALRGLAPEELWSLPGDPHPNALGHAKMTQALLPALLSTP